MKHETSRFVPILVAIGVVCGILVGSFFASHNAPGRLSIIKSGSNKVNDLFHLIDDEYVDSVDIQELVEKSMPQILRQLDPHSVYVPAKDVELAMQDLQGHFSGIGVQFTIYNDTVRIIRIIRGGPSESVGLKAGDRTVAIDGSPFVGEKVTNEETMKPLKGEKDGHKIDAKGHGSATAKNKSRDFRGFQRASHGEELPSNHGAGHLRLHFLHPQHI